MYTSNGTAMKTITENFGMLYHPVKAFIVYQPKEHNRRQSDVYVESYDMDDNGHPVNAHPLSIGESIALAKALDTSKELERGFLKPKGLMPKNVLHINPSQNGHVVWHTPQQDVDLLFDDRLD